MEASTTKGAYKPIQDAAELCDGLAPYDCDRKCIVFSPAPFGAHIDTHGDRDNDTGPRLMTDE